MVTPSKGGLGATVTRGAYGLRLTGLMDESSLVELPSACSWPLVRLSARAADTTGWVSSIDADFARLQMTDASWAEVDRLTGEAALVGPIVRSEDYLIHPFLGAPAAAFAWWNDHEAIHA